ncbi:nicotinate phosphoribosyltransferase [Drepanopeziza brunnea f. sp. 'multigermtubi' MB_m1]|uniref:nicotinate phosphoribosyltransferase n=1 Tax=Marssonina brunnea f. sp. multigermtubi (strain MB_m1) TaxID=1072389 RepID=K1WWI5_MARBU|nr:nicotinate phosphoribosyltransferase [Drepanopeziza brunnea f. sp. 'multigermtubi' MB_m1]EKD16867.1 nicotinate phosphoribosyltransferase [Drepanopeziza brunnea f. sp. 'multigermtubi' MB_m1]
MDFNSGSPYPEGVISFLDTDLYKLTMQCAVLKYFPKIKVTYAFKNRTPEKKLSRKAKTELGNIALSSEELRFLQSTCTYLNKSYLDFLKGFRLNPREQVAASFVADNDTGCDSDVGEVDLVVQGLWVETILYEIPLLALTSEAYFKFMDTDWEYEGQEEKAHGKGMRLLEAGCAVSEFGTRRRRDYHTQALVFRGLVKAKKEGEAKGLTGQISGTSNVHLAMRFGIPPIGTVAHEWFMGVAAITGDYDTATKTALRYWIGCFGEGVLGIALTDTFGTSVFLRAFNEPIGEIPDKPLSDTTDKPDTAVATTRPRSSTKTFAEVFTGVRQDSGDPANFVKVMREFYDKVGITSKKTIVFSDSLNIELCLEYKKISEAAGFNTSFGVGTFFTNDFVHLETGKKSTPLNIVIKLSSAAGNQAIKISDNIGKNTGDKNTVEKVKKELGYVEKDWSLGDEAHRWEK